MELDETIKNGSLFSEPPREVWIVSTPTGPDHVALTRQCAMEHAAIMAGDFPELGPWRVCKYVAEPFDRINKGVCSD